MMRRDGLEPPTRLLRVGQDHFEGAKPFLISVSELAYIRSESHRAIPTVFEINSLAFLIKFLCYQPS